MLALPVLALYGCAVSALSVGKPQQAALTEPQTVSPELYLIELSPGETRWITEDQKWELRRACHLLSKNNARVV